MAAKGGTSAACAVCKYQRRKCAADCQLAPYFPADQPRQFQNAHRLFGVSNILKILNRLDGPSQRAEAMRSIVYEANMRDRYPVHGCLGIILALYVQIQQAQLELEAVNAQLDLLRHQFNDPGGGSRSAPVMPPSTNRNGSVSSSNNNVLSLFHDDANNDAMVANGCGGLNQLWAAQQQHSCNGSNNSPPPAVRSRTFVLGSSSHAVAAATAGTVADNAAAVNDYDEISPYFDAIDDRQSAYVDDKQHYESSLESSLKDTVQSAGMEEHVSKKELKSAAACFSLTSLNPK